MKISIDTTDIDKLAKAMTRYGSIMPTQKANAALRKSVKPMFRRTQSEAPIAYGGREHNPLRAGRKVVRGGGNPNYLRRGGATRRDLRIKAVKPEASEIGRVLVGVNKKSGSVGWRTIFITRGTKMRKTKKGQNRGRMTANNFLQRSYDSTIDGVRADFLKEYRESFVAWAKATWPQQTR